ncbi:MAG: hypothetical protein ACRCW0_02945 [Clostridium sp.]
MSFYESTLYEIDLLIKGYQKKQKVFYNLMFTANYNSAGFIRGGKKFKPLDVFNDNSNIKKVDSETRKENLNYLLTLFEKDKVGENI